MQRDPTPADMAELDLKSDWASRCHADHRPASPAGNTTATREPEPAWIFKNCLQIAYSTPTKKKPR